MAPSKEQLARILVSDEKKYHLKIRFDKDKANYILRNIDDVLSHLTDNVASKNKDSLLPFLKYVKQYGRPDGNKVTFSTVRKTSDSNGWGRLTPDKGRGYVAVSRPVRHFLAMNLYSDHDLVNCHPILIKQLFELYKMNDAIKLLDNWNDHREHIFKQLIDASTLENKPSRDDCKKIAFCFLYDGSIEKRFDELGVDIPSSDDGNIYKIYHLSKNICQHVIKLREHIANDFPETWDDLPWDRKKGDTRKDAGKFSTLVQHIERHIMLIAADVAKTFGYEVGDYCHDGLFLSDDGYPADVSDDFYEAVHDEVFSKTGFHITMVGKEMHIDKIFQPFQDQIDGVPETIDHQKINSFLTDLFASPTLNLNKTKTICFQKPYWNDKEIQIIIDNILAKYFIRVIDKWYMINTETGLWSHEKPFTKETFNQLTAGTILAGEYANANIPMYEKTVFKDPDTVKPHEYNTYYKKMRYDRSNRTELTDEELLTIQPFTNHLIEVICRNNMDSFMYLLVLLKQKLLNPFVVSHVSRAIVMYGEEGAGKTSWITALFNWALGPEFVAQQVTFKSITKSDGFTNALENKLFVVVNDVPEADYNHNDMFENLKSLITDEYRRSHPKFQGERSVNNTIMILATTNNRNSFKISNNDRRYFILDVSGKYLIAHNPKYIQYHANLRKCIDEHWELIVRYILSTNASPNMPIPQTEALLHARSLSKCAVGYWLEQKCNSGEISENWEGRIMKAYNDYKLWCKSEDRRPLCKTKFIGRLADKYYICTTGDVKDRSLIIYDFDGFKRSIGWNGFVENDSEPDLSKPLT